MVRLGSVELGGTKTLVGLGESLDDLGEIVTIPTTHPQETLHKAIEHLRPAGVEGVGVASFGPIEMRPGHRWQGHITTTPKPGWSHTPVVRRFETGLGIPVGFDTDVNGAALGEGRWGAAAGLTDYAYITVGTGIGGGIVSNGAPIHGAPHPEFGHVIVRRHPEDRHPGSCPFHGDCLEGMASGPAIQARFGKPAQDLSDAERDDAIGMVSFYLGQGVRNLVYATAPERVIIGGGVSKLAGFHDSVVAELRSSLAGYPDLDPQTLNSLVVPPALDDLSGLAGGLLLAEGAIRDSAQ